MRNSDAVILFNAIQSTERRRRKYYTVKEQEFLNGLKTPITLGFDIGPQTGKELERIYRKSQGG